MPRYRGARWRRATQEQRLLLLAGVSSRYWEPLEESPRFVGLEIDGRSGTVRIRASRQREVFDGWCEDPESLLDVGVVAIGSIETDEQALHIAIDLTRPFLLAEAGSRARLVDMGSIPDVNDTDTEGNNIGRPWWRDTEEAAILVYHNIRGECADDRVELLRDFITDYSEATHIVVLAGADPVEFFLTRVHLRPDAILHTDGRARRISR